MHFFKGELFAMKLLLPFSFQYIKGVYHYLFNCHIKKRGGSLLVDGRTSIKTSKGSNIVLYDDLTLGYNSLGDNGRSTLLCMHKNASFIVTGNARIFYGGDILLFEGAEFHIGCSFINSNCTIRVTDKISIGNDCAIGWDFSAFDTNFHELNGSLKSGPINIEDHVWVGAKVTILPGVNIGVGSVIAAGSIVAKDVPPHTLVAGVPARIIKENIEWRM